MRFWDSSAIVPLLLEEPTTASLLALLRSDQAMLVWWATEIECASALARLEREGALPSDLAEEALARLRALALAWSEVQPLDAVRDTAIRFLRVHPLRASDAMQLAAAFAAAEGRPSTLEMVCLDARLAAAARREGFQVLPVAAQRS